MENKVGFFNEAPNVQSITRLAFALLIGQAIFISTYMIISGSQVVDVIAIFTTITTVATTLKLVQKRQENKHNKPINTTDNEHN